MPPQTIRKPMRSKYKFSWSLYPQCVFYTHRAKCLEFLGILRKGMCLPINSFELQETILSPF